MDDLDFRDKGNASKEVESSEQLANAAKGACASLRPALSQIRNGYVINRICHRFLMYCMPSHIHWPGLEIRGHAIDLTILGMSSAPTSVSTRSGSTL